LALFVAARGAKSWHFRFSCAGRQPRISLGTYPEVSLKEARELRDEARALVAKGIDPRVHRRRARKAAVVAAENTFEAVFQRWRNFKALSLKTGRQSTLSPRSIRDSMCTSSPMPAGIFPRATLAF